MIAANILVVDDELDICSLVKEILEDEGYKVTVAKNAAEARAARGGISFDLILLDIWMPDTDGISLLKEWSESGLGNMPVIMMSGHGTVETAVEATRLGAYDFLEKPLSLAKLVLTVKHALETADLQQENLRLRQYSPQDAEIIGRSEAMRQLREQIKRIASHNAPVLIIGEAGTDKEAIARVLHNQSAYCDGPFVSVNMTAISQDGPAIELFGKETGGQIASGYLEKAAGGTLFLKDITGMGMATQSKLQAALEGRSFTRIGGVEPVKLDARVMAATPAPLDELVRGGSFRNDLYFQLNIVPIHVPPIREHFEDVPELLEYYVNYFVESEGLSYKRFSTAAQNRLRMYSWPGNVREIKNLVQRLLIIGTSDTIDLPDVEKSLGEQPGKEKVESLYNFDMPLRDARDRFEKAYLEHQLKLYNGSVSKIAKVAGMERTHLYRKLKSLNIELKS